MSIALRNKQMLALIILAFLTVLVISAVLFGAVTHINVFHLIGLVPNGFYPHG